MSKDLKRNVEAERKELKAKQRKMAELKQPHYDVPEASAKRPVTDEKKKLKAKKKVIEALKDD